MDLKKKIFVSCFSLFLFGMFIVSLMSTAAIWHKTSRELDGFQTQEISRVKNELQNYVNIAYATVESNYALAEDPKYLEGQYGARLRSVIDIAEKMILDLQKQVESGEITREEAKDMALRQIKSIRYENGKGYIWVNDLTLPYPTMIMHPTVPALDGKVLDNPKYNCALGKKQNLFQAFVDQTETTGEGFVDYLWPKPTKDGLTSDQPKLSYVRRISKWGWIIGTGIYVDDARADIIDRIKSDLAKMRYADGTGYFWINDMGEPYPTMIMHPTVPALNGTVLDAPKYDCALGKKMNLFQAMVEQTTATGEGFVDYLWPKPTKDGLTADQPKLSFVRRFAPLGWIIGTGTYIDSINTTVKARKEATRVEIYSMIGKFSAAAAVLSILAFIALHYMTRSIILPITKVIGDLGEGSSQVSLASAQIASSSQVLADNASSQAASLEETSASMEEMTAMNSLNAENTIQADVTMQEALNAVEEANTSMGILTTSMRDISVSSEETSKIVKTIDEIAFQTNLLALNAAVEAARAGEAGAGFAVVADEVRNLAMRAAEAAQSTSQMIAGTVEKIKHGEKIVREASTSFTQVREQTQQVGKLVGEINIASQQQSQGLGQVNIATSKMGGNVQNIAASAEESASVSHALNAQIQMLRQTIHNLVDLTGATMNISSDEDLPPENLTMLPMAQRQEPCWIETNCPPDRRDACPAYPDFGDKCWMLTGTSCGGVTHKTLHEKMKACRSCKFYKTRVTG